MSSDAPRSNRLLWIMFASYFAFGSILNVVGVIIPIVIRQYQLSLFAGGLLAFAFFISFGVFSVPAGLVADRIGPKPVVVTGMLFMCFGCGGIPFARGFQAITAFALLVGAGVALLQTAGNPLIGRLDRRENYHRNLTLTIGFCGIGAFVGPFGLSALQAHGQPWQTLYVGYCALCGVLAILLFFSQFPAMEKNAEGSFQLGEIVRLLGRPIAITYFFAVFFYVGAEVGTASWIVKFFQLIHGIRSDAVNTAAHAGFLHSLPALPALTVSLFWGLQGVGRLTSGPGIQRLGARTVLRLYSLGTIGALLFAIYAPPMLAAVGFAVCGFFTSVLITLLFSGAIHTFPQRQGAISGLLITASIGGAFIPPLVGLVADHVGLRTAMLIPVLSFCFVFLVGLFGKASYE